MSKMKNDERLIFLTKFSNHKNILEFHHEIPYSFKETYGRHIVQIRKNIDDDMRSAWSYNIEYIPLLLHVS